MGKRPGPWEPLVCSSDFLFFAASRFFFGSITAVELWIFAGFQSLEFGICPVVRRCCDLMAFLAHSSVLNFSSFTVLRSCRGFHVLGFSGWLVHRFPFATFLRNSFSALCCFFCICRMRSVFLRTCPRLARRLASSSLANTSPGPTFGTPTGCSLLSSTSECLFFAASRFFFGSITAVELWIFASFQSLEFGICP